jgi:hypothetical protein
MLIIRGRYLNTQVFLSAHTEGYRLQIVVFENFYRFLSKNLRKTTRSVSHKKILNTVDKFGFRQ